MWIGTLALSGIGIPFILGDGLGFAGFYSKDVILRSRRTACTTTVGMIAFWLGIIAAFMTAFYSGRLMFMTFYGKYRGDHHTWDHAHKSPPVMLIPLYVLGVGAALSGFVAYDWFVGEGWEHFWGTSIAVKANGEVLHHAHEVPAWVKLAPLVVAPGRHRAELLLLRQPAGPAGGDRAALPAASTTSCSTSGISTSSTTPSSSAGARDRPRPLEEGRRRHHRRARARRHCRPRAGPRRAC